MSLLTSRERDLVALGAALGSNCNPCIEHHIPASRNVGPTDSQIAEVVRQADKARQVPARRTRETALALLSEPTPAAEADKRCCK